MHVSKISDAIKKKYKVRLKSLYLTSIIYRHINRRAGTVFRKEIGNTFGLLEWPSVRSEAQTSGDHKITTRVGWMTIKLTSRSILRFRTFRHGYCSGEFIRQPNGISNARKALEESKGGANACGRCSATRRAAQIRQGGALYGFAERKYGQTSVAHFRVAAGGGSCGVEAKTPTRKVNYPTVAVGLRWAGGGRATRPVGSLSGDAA